MPAPKRKTAPVPPQRKASRGKAVRQPRMKADEKAAITKAARDLSKEINGRLNEIEETVRGKTGTRKYTPAQRHAANERRARQRRVAAKRSGDEPPRCKGTNAAGKPCKLAPLIPDNWDGPSEPTGLYCIHHDPNITRDEAFSFQLYGSANKPVPRRVTPGEIAHELMKESPRHFLKPYLKALGLRMTDEGEIEEAGTGLKLYGYSRGGEVIRSHYPDLVGQVNVAEKLWDRIFGKPRQAVDLASTNTSVAVHITMDVDRVDKVSSVLASAGALPLGNGNGNGHEVIEGRESEPLQLSGPVEESDLDI